MSRTDCARQRAEAIGANGPAFGGTSGVSHHKVRTLYLETALRRWSAQLSTPCAPAEPFRKLRLRSGI
eukprot:353702-Prymnesium_polylepis.1